jgi:hypothetical protein
MKTLSPPRAEIVVVITSMTEKPQTIRFRYKLSNWEIEVEGDEGLVKELFAEIKKRELPPYGGMDTSQGLSPGLYT